MVRIQHQRVAGLKETGLYTFSANIVRRAELLMRSRILRLPAFPQRQQAFTFDLSHFRLDVPAAADSRVSADIFPL